LMPTLTAMIFVFLLSRYQDTKASVQENSRMHCFCDREAGVLQRG
jgi:hypothetical protein